MKILLVSATRFELSPLLKKIKKISLKGNISSFRFASHSVDVLITGPGIANTSFYLGKSLNKKYDLAINAGIGGCFRKNIPLGTVVNVTSDCFSDFGTEDGNKFLSAKEIGLESDIEFKSSARLINSLKKVKGITVNTVHGNSESIRKVKKKFKPDVETMEGAAFFMACQSEKTPCIQIRAISNYVERRNKKKWKMSSAIENLSASLEKILSHTLK